MLWTILILHPYILIFFVFFVHAPPRISEPIVLWCHYFHIGRAFVIFYVFWKFIMCMSLHYLLTEEKLWKKTMKKTIKKLCRVGGKSWTLAEVLPFSINMHNKNLQFTYSPFTVIHVICTITNQSCNDAFINLTKPFVKDVKYFESREIGLRRALCEVFCDI